jgi:hypothetical protein
MKRLRDDIMELYDTTLGKFRFFHRFIQILLKLEQLVVEWGDHWVSVKREQEEQLSEIQSLVKKVEDLELQITYLKQKAPLTTFRTPTQIMDAQFKAINPDD